MDTLTKEIRYSLFETREQYLKMKEEWAKRPVHTREQHLLYAILRGQDWRRAFTPITKQIKINNGAKPFNEGWFNAADRLDYCLSRGENQWIAEARKKLLETFGDSINETVVQKAWAHMGNYKDPYRG